MTISTVMSYVPGEDQSHLDPFNPFEALTLDIGLAVKPIPTRNHIPKLSFAYCRPCVLSRRLERVHLSCIFTPQSRQVRSLKV